MPDASRAGGAGRRTLGRSSRERADQARNLDVEHEDGQPGCALRVPASARRRILPRVPTALGLHAFVLPVGDVVSETVRLRVAALADAIRVAALAHVTDVVPGMASVVVHHDALGVGRASLARALDDLAAAAGDGAPREARLVEIPVCYEGDDLAPDLAKVAAAHGMPPAELVARHAAGAYVVHMLGFLPGFPYLGGLEPRLHTPRRATPRTRVPAGSVGIGGAQTGIYPLESPGGWHLIGRTPLRLFDASRAEPALLRAGDRVRFVAIARATFDAMRADEGGA